MFSGAHCSSYRINRAADGSLGLDSDHSHDLDWMFSDFKSRINKIKKTESLQPWSSSVSFSSWCKDMLMFIRHNVHHVYYWTNKNVDTMMKLEERLEDFMILPVGDNYNPSNNYQKNTLETKHVDPSAGPEEKSENHQSLWIQSLESWKNLVVC